MKKSIVILLLALIASGICHATLMYHEDANSVLDDAIADADAEVSSAESLLASLGHVDEETEGDNFLSTSSHLHDDNHAVEDNDEWTASFLSTSAQNQQATCTLPPTQDCGQAFVGGKPAGNRNCVKIDRRFVTTAIVCAFLHMRDAAQADGTDLYLNSGFRTNQEQTYLYNCYINKNCNGGNLAAKPGTSQHQNGIALDIRMNPGNYAWLRHNAAKYGFTRTVSSENWHWEYHPGKPCDAYVKYECQTLPFQQVPPGLDYTSSLNKHPAGSADLCYAGNDKGRCMDENACHGTTHSGLCPGSRAIKCCVEPAGQQNNNGGTSGGNTQGAPPQRRCKAYGIEGMCVGATASCDGEKHAHFCPSGDMCCVKPKGWVGAAHRVAKAVGATQLANAAMHVGRDVNDVLSALKQTWVKKGCTSANGVMRGACVPAAFCKDQTVVAGGRCAEAGDVCCTPTRWATSDWQRELNQVVPRAKKCDDGSGMPCIKNTLCKRANRHVIPKLCMSSPGDVMCCK
eukprot:TRINITY_DN2126_c0_g1_i1.p1 TRINITY_DN2126_c0_g1~~TRINITY_DN2126_c0_g1_i1.p1  ORF type:complete len:514 (+),score=122.66 TRINITY_DN2126_c0_g1_i1:133-1674(+)